ncbi:hypothetical protein J3R82DRAFT_11139 [Butyriboletus roseoflavus]|nr:hypothetical protein J3R82DRAFT_11139 [Butyriboletus roseoflavus]
MREANFAFPAQNRACVCISSQLYDRRALDTTSPLPLFNSLHHLTYLTSTSPRIREIMTMDGGLERLVRILYDFCMCPPPPENPNVIYGLSSPNTRPPKLVPTLNPPTFDKHAAYRFSLAFQCVVNIGVRGSERIRSRVVQAGTLDVVGCILEAWLANKGFAVGPSSSATGLPRESREQRLARRQALAEQRQRDGAAELTRALQRQIAAEESVRQEHTHAEVNAFIDEDVSMVDVSVDGTSDISIIMDVSSQPVSIPVTSHQRRSYGRHSSPSPREIDTDTSADTSTNATPSSRTPTATVVNGRERSGTIIARPMWDEPPGANLTIRSRPLRTRTRIPTSPDESTDNSRPETETEDDGDGDVDMDQSQDTDDTTASTHATLPRAPRVQARSITQRPRRTVGIIADAPETAPLEVNADAHIIINHGQGGGVDGEGVGVVGVEDGIVSLEPNDDFAMGAPPGAPGAMDDTAPRNMLGMDAPVLDRRTRTAPDATPRATVVALPPSGPVAAVPVGTIRGGITEATRDHATTPPIPTLGRTPSHVHHHRDTDSGPYKDEDVLLSLQLLAYLSKYPHVRQAFYKQRVSFHPAAANLPINRATPQPVAGPSMARTAPTQPAKEIHGFFRALTSATARGKEKEKAPVAATSPATTTLTTSPRMTNVFSLVERFTFRPSSSENDLPNPPPKLPPEIQYWAGVIMRNACRKDDSRGGIRQCANMLCGKWESYPREFAKCRRCRKAKYCGKECQSTAWSEGHRFWCSAKDGEDVEELVHDHAHGPDGADGSAAARAERRAERERLARERAAAAGVPIPINQVQLVSPNSLPPSTLTAQPSRQRVTALPPNVPQPIPSPTSPAYAQSRNRRRAETVSGATTVVGMTPQGRPVYRHEVAWLADGRGRDPEQGAGGGTPGPAHAHAPLGNMIWESTTQGDNNIALG